MAELYGSDAYSPAEIARRIEAVGEAKARMAWLPLALLGVLAGVFIGLGAMLFVLVKSDPTLGFAASAVLGGLVFAVGLFMVVVAGAELFTGNNLIVMAWPMAGSARRKCCATGPLCAWPTSWGPQDWRCWCGPVAMPA